MHVPPMDWVERIIRINTETDRNNEEVVRFLKPLMESSNLKVDIQEVTENGTKFQNLIAFSHTPNAKDLMVFNSHLDTVSGGNSKDWTKTKGDPFRATKMRDRIYGLGTADVKLDLLCKIIAARKAMPYGRPIALVGTFGEERGLVGAMELLEKKRIKPKYAMVGEPSNLELIYAHKGHLVVTLGIDLGKQKTDGKIRKWKGKSAHSSTPEIGNNAILKGLTEVLKRGVGIASLEGGSGSNKVPDFCSAKLTETQTKPTLQVFQVVRYLDELGREFRKRRDTRFSPAYSTQSLNLAEMKGTVLELTFDVRTLPGTDLPRLTARIEKELKKIGVMVQEIVINEALNGRRNSTIMSLATKALKKCGIKKPVRATKASSTEAAVYSQHGAQAIVFGPGISVGNVHRPNEYQLISQMKVATQLYTELMNQELPV